MQGGAAGTSGATKSSGAGAAVQEKQADDVQLPGGARMPLIGFGTDKVKSEDTIRSVSLSVCQSVSPKVSQTDAVKVPGGARMPLIGFGADRVKSKDTIRYASCQSVSRIISQAVSQSVG